MFVALSSVQSSVYGGNSNQLKHLGDQLYSVPLRVFQTCTVWLCVSLLTVKVLFSSYGVSAVGKPLSVDQGPADELHGEESSRVTAETGFLSMEKLIKLLIHAQTLFVFQVICTHLSKSSSKAQLHSVCISLSIDRQTERQKTLDPKKTELKLMWHDFTNIDCDLKKTDNVLMEIIFFPKNISAKEQ